MYIVSHLYVVKHSWSFEILNFELYIFWIFKVLKIHIFEIVNVFLVSNRLLSSHIFYHQFISNIWVLWKSFVKKSFFNDKIFHFQKSLIKSKFKIGSNEFLIWVYWHSCVLKRNNVPWLPWCQMANHYTQKTFHIFKERLQCSFSNFKSFHSLF